MATLFFYYYNHFGETKVGTVFQQKAQPTRKTRKYRQTDSYKTARGKKSIQTLHEKSHSD